MRFLFFLISLVYINIYMFTYKKILRNIPARSETRFGILEQTFTFSKLFKSKFLLAESIKATVQLYSKFLASTVPGSRGVYTAVLIDLLLNLVLVNLATKYLVTIRIHTKFLNLVI